MFGLVQPKLVASIWEPRQQTKDLSVLLFLDVLLFLLPLPISQVNKAKNMHLDHSKVGMLDDFWGNLRKNSFCQGPLVKAQWQVAVLC